jgi:hypothetical protein
MVGDVAVCSLLTLLVEHFHSLLRRVEIMPTYLSIRYTFAQAALEMHAKHAMKLPRNLTRTYQQPVGEVLRFSFNDFPKRSTMPTTVTNQDLSAQHAFVTRFELRGQKQWAPRHREMAQAGARPLRPRTLNVEQNPAESATAPTGNDEGIDETLRSFGDVCELIGNEAAGHVVIAYWDEYGWCRGVVESYNKRRKEHTIVYDDGYREEVTLPDDTIKLSPNTHEKFG